MTTLHKRTAHAIVNLFETGTPFGDYGAVTLLPGDTGRLTYGRAQTTIASGNLALLIADYCHRADAALGPALQAYLPALEQRAHSLDEDARLHDLLRRAGGDPVMQEAQDAFFDRVYWEPAMRSAQFIGATLPLSFAVIYDSRIHGSWHRLRDRVNAERGPLAELGEQDWTAAYVATRRAWLAGHANRLLRRTVYRMDSFQQLIEAGNWRLTLPITVRGTVLDEALLTGGPPQRASAMEPEDRLLKLERPFLQGPDVEALQRALAEAGLEVSVDGVFGPGTERAVIAFQAREGLTVDGVAGPATLSALGALEAA
ncbi:MAG: peptidoglycan-binding protein [Marivibrio sp.]|uniref:peptidoglycan-binding protein n=1 Tax=Marivibrio sp. TaxID=2039719 RepID=UPI0032EB4AD8